MGRFLSQKGPLRSNRSVIKQSLTSCLEGSILEHVFLLSSL